MRPWLIAACLTLAGCADYLPFSGGALQGDVTPLPADRSELAAANIVQLETQPDDPYSVNLWIAGDQDRLYVYAGDNLTTWVEHLTADPRARLQVGERVYAVAATRVSDANEFAVFADMWAEKYSSEGPRGESPTTAWLYSLDTR